MRLLLYLAIFGETLFLSYLLMPLIIHLASRWKVVDQPGHRKVHHAPKPLMGGVGIFSSFAIVIAGNLIGFMILHGTGWVQEHLVSMVRIFPLFSSAMPRLLLILAGGFFIHLLGLADDIFKDRLSYKLKFAVQFVVVLIVVIGGVRTDFMEDRIMNVLVATLWIVGITNSFNLLDNLDGLTAGVSVISAGILFAVALLQGQIFFAFILCALAGASFGFLIHNFHPSKLFMGDSGSLFLGYMFGTLTVTGSYVVKSSASLLPVLLPILVLSIPLYDTFSVMLIRWREGRPLFLGDKRHFSHRLLELGLSHREAVIFIYLVSFCVGIAAMLLPYVSLAASVLLVLQAIIVYALITILIATRRRAINRSQT
jgi:UDP-GlcNAc:undecaprenyl-phosphate GlcNAc-1-phosphate transferase